MKGYVQVYTGNGKGKTTAALGLALRAVGANLKVYIAQFAKSGQYSEINALEKYRESITIQQFGRIGFINGDPDAEDIQAAREGLEKVKEAMCSGSYDVVILDEANIATYYRLLSVDDLLAFIDAKPEHVELVITGREADARIIGRADLVTQMKEVKHYYRRGVEAREGIEK
jgi:cob(I)alamin adenosyltransferase